MNARHCVDTDLLALQALSERCHGAVTLISNPVNGRTVAFADIVLGAVLVQATVRPPLLPPDGPQHEQRR
jgi:hypothetical protein